MVTRAIQLVLSVCLATILGWVSVAQAGDQITYPEKFHRWQHVKSMVILPGHPLANPFVGMHHIYANPKAVEGLDTGIYRNGATFVFDLLDYAEEGKAIVEGKRTLVGVMVRHTKKYWETGGWGFEGFAGDSRTERLTKDGGQACFACHTQAVNNLYVFSRSRH